MRWRGRKFSRSEITLIILLIVVLIAVLFRWDEVIQGIIRGWERFNPIHWFSE